MFFTPKSARARSLGCGAHPACISPANPYAAATRTLAQAHPDSACNLVQGTARFITTRWSVVLRAGQAHSPEADEALEQLCRTYWYPLYAFARRKGLASPAAQDVTQGFFARLLDKSLLAGATPKRGRFRSFLLTTFERFMAQEYRALRAKKRGGGAAHVPWDDMTAEDRYQREPADHRSPEQIFERRWALTLMETVLKRLREEHEADGKSALFTALLPHLSADQGKDTATELGAKLGLNANAARQALHRLRRRYRALFRLEIMQTVTGETEFEEELRHLLAALSS